MDFPGFNCISRGFHAISRGFYAISRGFHAISRGFHAIPRAFTPFTGVLSHFAVFVVLPTIVPGLFFVHFPVKSVKRFVRFFELAQFGTRVS